MAQECPKCNIKVEGDRFRCPKCGSTLMASMIDVRIRSIPSGLEAERPSKPAGPPEVDTRVKEQSSFPRPRPVQPPEPPEPERPRRPTPAPPPTPKPQPQPEVVIKPKPSRPAPVVPPPRPESPAGSGHGMPTIGIANFDLNSLNVAKHNYYVELPVGQDRWAQLFSIVGTGKSQIIGRTTDPRLEIMKTVASRHLRFRNKSNGLYLDPNEFETLNGVYRKITTPTKLEDRTRFRIGSFLITYRAPAPRAEIEPQAIEGENLLARELRPLGELEFLRPDGRPGLRYPILKPGETVIGRGGVDPEGRESQVDIPLTDDPKVSRRHARIVWTNNEPFLEDLQSTSWTWIQVAQPSKVRDGDVFRLGELVVRVVRAK